MSICSMQPRAIHICSAKSVCTLYGRCRRAAASVTIFAQVPPSVAGCPVAGPSARGQRPATVVRTTLAGRCPRAPVVLAASRRWARVGSGMARSGWGHRAGAAGATARRRRGGKSRNDGWRERQPGKRRVIPRAKVDGRRGRKGEDTAKAMVGCPASGRSTRKPHG